MSSWYQLVVDRLVSTWYNLIRKEGVSCMENYKIYAHINKINGKIYIGQTSQKDVRRRWNNGWGYRNNYHFNKAIQKYGWNNFQHIVIFENLSLEVANIIEDELIRKYKTTNPSYGYNINTGGNSGYKLSQETKKKISEKLSGENSPFYGLYGKDHPRYGIPMPDEAKAIISEKNKKKNWTQETISKKKEAGARTSERQKGKIPWHMINAAAKIKRGTKISEEQRNKISQTLKKHPPMLGKKMSKESKEKMSKTRIENGTFAGKNNPASRPVVQLDMNTLEFIKEYECASFAAKELGIQRTGITFCCQGKYKYSGGYVWRYKDEFIRKET